MTQDSWSSTACSSRRRAIRSWTRIIALVVAIVPLTLMAGWGGPASPVPSASPVASLSPAAPESAPSGGPMGPPTGPGFPGGSEASPGASTFEAAHSTRPKPLGSGTPPAPVYHDGVLDYRSYYGEDDLKDGIAEYRRTLAANPKAATARLYLALLLEQSGNVAEAREEVERWRTMAVKPESNPVAAELMGNLALDAGNLDEALSWYEKEESLADGAQIVPDQARVNQAYVLLWKDGPAKALQCLLKARQDFRPTIPFVMNMRCALELCLDHVSNAIEALQVAIEAAPGSLQLQSSLLALLLQAGKVDEAQAALAKARTYTSARKAWALEMKVLARQTRSDSFPARALRLQLNLGPMAEHATAWKARYGTGTTDR